MIAGNSKEPVCCIVGWWPGPNDATGIFIQEHVKAISRNRPVDVIYIEVLKGPWAVPSFDLRTTEEHGYTLHQVRILTPVRRFGASKFLVRRAYRTLLHTIEKQAKPAIFHIHVRTEVTEQVIPMAAERGVPVVVTEHNTFYHAGIRDLPAKEQEAHRRAIQRWFAHPLIKAVLPVSRDLARVLENDFKVEQALMHIIPNVATDDFEPASPRVPRPFRIMLAAVWRPPKDHGVFIAALRSLPMPLAQQCRIDWAGYGPSMEQIMERCATELPHIEIRFPGRSTKAEMARLMQQAHVFVLPTTAENLPCVIAESLCCGTPVISMAVNGVPEMVDNTNGILVRPNDPDALAAALVSCITGSSLFNNATIAQNALARYSTAAVGAEIEKVYRTVLSASEGRSPVTHE